jgi:ketosteroid isomerase-like protein
MTDEPQDVRAIADDLVAMARAGEFDAIGEKYWDDDVVSIEAGDGPMAVTDGIDSVRGKSEWWNGAHEIHGVEVHGPWVNGDQFTVRFVMDVTVKDTSTRMTMDEIALYTIDDGKIIEERFFY